MTNHSGANPYQHDQISSADPVELIVLLYDGAIQRIKYASQEMVKGNHLASGIALYRALAILAELRKSLNMQDGGEVAVNLDRLYLFMHEELVKGNLERKPERLDKVLPMLSDFREAWVEIANQAKTAAAAAASAARAGAAAYRGASEPAGLAIKA
ncbi:MAG: flagellar export chaperone FliS [Nitrospirae bacterium]|nr:MAG: flagellar export chaperone FliS [Nitrospirota bacterium]